MKKQLTVGELRAYYACKKPKELSFCSENQAWYTVSAPCKFGLSFQTMLVYENPNIVCLKSSNGSTISFDRVKYAEIDTDATVLGTVLTLFCGNPQCEPSDTYVFVVA